VNDLKFSTLRQANKLRLPQFKDRHGRPAHSQPDGSDWKLSAWSNAALGELGELAHLIKKIERGDYEQADLQQELADELGGVPRHPCVPLRRRPRRGDRLEVQQGLEARRIDGVHLRRRRRAGRGDPRGRQAARQRGRVAVTKPRASAIVEVIRWALDEADKLDPRERDQLYAALVADLRSRRPESVSPLTIGPPTEPIRDPRGPRGDR
jgi:hypothetical protein